jgi:hypothetical protein
MLDCFGPRRLVVGGVVLTLMGVLGTVPALAQQQLGNKEDVEYKFNPQSTLFGNLRDGGIAFDPKAHKNLVELAAQFFVYRITWPSYRADKTLEGSLTGLRKRFTELMTAPATLSGKNKDLMKPLAHQLIGCFKQVLDLPFEANHQAVTNAALMLQDLAKCRQDEVQDFLMDLTKPDKDRKYAYSPFIRMCAIRGLGEFSNPNWAPIDDQQNASLAKVQAKLKRDVERLNRIWEFVNFPYAPQGTSPAHEDAFVFIRREGVKALAQSQVPAYSAEVKKEVLGPAAKYLLHITLGGKLAEGTPAVTLQERLEAALGLCNMKVAETPTYNADFTVWAATVCLAEFTSHYNRDFAYFAKVPGKDKQNTTPRLEELPWVAYAARLDDGLTALAANMGKNSKLDVLRNKLGATLTTIRERRKTIEPEVPPALAAYAETLRPMNPELFPGTKEPKVTLAQ